MNHTAQLSKQSMSALAVLTLALVGAGCDRRDGTDMTDRREEVKEERKATTERREDAAEVRAADADNTKKNVRDRDDAAKTPFDQKENETDRTITQKIRQGVVGLDNLSMDGRNVKIITADGVVTLRGPVDSDQERMRIVELAKKQPNVVRVDDQLEVARD